MMSRSVAIGSFAFAISAATCGSHAGTIAYYRFEEGTAGTKVGWTPTEGQPASSPVVDSANGNNMRTFNENTGGTYTATTPTRPLASGASNNLAMQFTANGDFYSEAATGGGAAGTTLNDHTFNQLTLEASVRFSTDTGWQTFVGRDRAGEPGSVFLQKSGDENGDYKALRVAISTTAGGGFVSSIGTADGDTFSTIQTDVWYNVAATYDGASLKLFVQNNQTGEYELQGSSAVTGALVPGNENWTIGRGWYYGPADNYNGLVDEVRIGDTALAPSEFLFAAVPEPTTVSLAALAATAGLLRRRRPA